MASEHLQHLYVVRHGESEGNVANLEARRNGALSIDIPANDRGVPLSAGGREQAHALGQRFQAEPPDVLWVSPFERTKQTAKLASSTWRPPPQFVVEEKLRERDLGELNRLTAAGIASRFPEEARARARVGKFEYRPPNGESWSDVISRLRGVVDDLQTTRFHRVMIVTHQVVVLCLRYILENLTVEELMDIDRRSEIANCSVTRYRVRGDAFELEAFNDVAHLVIDRAPVTQANDSADVG